MKNITLITGAGRGIGKQIALKFANEHHNLVLLVQKNKQEKDLTRLLRKKKIKFQIFVGNLTDNNFIDLIDKKVLKIHNLINNAAIANTDFFINVKNNDLDEIIEVNIKSVFKLSRIFAKKMIKYKIKGNIINLSSQLGHVGAYNRTAYCATKFALEGLTKSMALDLSKFGIRVNSIAPTKTIVNKDEIYLSKKKLNTIKKKIPLGKFSTTQEIAGIAYFLTTKIAGSITGASIVSDGGWTSGK